MTTRLANWMFQWMFMCVTRTSWKFEADDGSPRFMPEDAIVLWVCMCLLLTAAACGDGEVDDTIHFTIYTKTSPQELAAAK